jgi:hypothetical protein
MVKGTIKVMVRREEMITVVVKGEVMAVDIEVEVGVAMEEEGEIKEEAGMIRHLEVVVEEEDMANIKK